MIQNLINKTTPRKAGQLLYKAQEKTRHTVQLEHVTAKNMQDQRHCHNITNLIGNYLFLCLLATALMLSVVQAPKTVKRGSASSQGQQPASPQSHSGGEGRISNQKLMLWVHKLNDLANSSKERALIVTVLKKVKETGDSSSAGKLQKILKNRRVQQAAEASEAAAALQAQDGRIAEAAKKKKDAMPTGKYVGVPIEMSSYTLNISIYPKFILIDLCGGNKKFPYVAKNGHLSITVSQAIESACFWKPLIKRLLSGMKKVTNCKVKKGGKLIQMFTNGELKMRLTKK